MTTTVIDDIGILVTNDPALGDGPLGLRRDAALVLEGGLVTAVTDRGAAGDRRLSVQGRCVLPGFVDSHSHLVFAGDRSAEFVSRMAGRSYAVGGIQVSVDATRSASDDDLRASMSERRHEALRAGVTTIEIKSGYGLTPEHEARLVRLAREITSEVTFLGAHVVPTGAGRDEYVRQVIDEQLPAAVKAGARWADAFCEEGAFDEDETRAILTAARERGLGLRLHANQLGPGPGVRLGVELGCASVDHCTYLSDDDIEALAGSDTVATLLFTTDFSTRQPYPDARRLLDAGATVALATNCNPGSSNTTSMEFAIALAVRDGRMTAEEAVWAATAGGARALRRTDVGGLAPGMRADAVVLDAPSYEHIPYRPGVPLVAGVLVGGEEQDITRPRAITPLENQP